MFDVELTEILDPAGNTFSLVNGRTRSVLSEIGGGMPPIEYLTSSGPLQDGETLRGFRLRPRSYTLLVRWSGCTRDQYWQYRSQLINMIRPNRQVINTIAPLTLRKTYMVNGAMARRDLYVMPADGPQFQGSSPGQWDEHGFTETIRFTAFDPAWYDSGTTVVATIPSTTDSLVFPFTAPFVFGLGVISQTVNITYTGTLAAYPTITINGPVGGPQLQNVTTGELLALNYTIAVGERVTFNLAYGSKTVVNNFGANLIGYLTTSSDLATWHLEPEPGAAGGVNQITLAGSGATGATLFTISYQRRFIGL